MLKQKHGAKKDNVINVHNDYVDYLETAARHKKEDVDNG